MVSICILVGILRRRLSRITNSMYTVGKQKLLPDISRPKWKRGPRSPPPETSSLRGAAGAGPLFFHSSLLSKGLPRCKNLTTNDISPVFRMALETNLVSLHKHVATKKSNASANLQEGATPWHPVPLALHAYFGSERFLK